MTAPPCAPSDVPSTEAPLASLLQLIGAAVFRIDPSTLDVTLNGPAPTGVFAETAPEQLVGPAFWSDFIEGAHRQLLEAHLRSVASDGQPRSVEHGVRVHAADLRWVRTSVVKAKSQGADVLLAAMVDVTGSSANERQWRHVESWLSTLGEALPFPFWICDRDDRVTLQNPVSIARVGDAVGKRVGELDISPRAVARWRSAAIRALKGETVRDEFQTGSERRRFYIRVVSPVRVEEEIRGTLAIDFEVTELKEAEARLRASLAELAHAQEALVERRELAALGEMAAVVAHEVRNPLGVISNSVSLLRKHLAPSAPAELCDVIEDEVHRLNEVVTSLLEFIRPEAPVFRPVPLVALVDETVQHLLRSEGAAARIRVTRSVPAPLPELKTDSRLLSIILMNVARNAVQAMNEEGELAVSIQALQRDDGEWVRISLRDSGPGIPAGMGARILQPFVTTRSKGVGLGLAIVNKLVQQLRGEFALTSAPGEGTTCTLHLPCVLPVS